MTKKVKIPQTEELQTRGPRGGWGLGMNDEGGGDELKDKTILKIEGGRKGGREGSQMGTRGMAPGGRENR